MKNSKKITKITNQVNNKDRYNVFINDKYSFSMSADQYLDNPYLRSGYEISDVEIEKLKGASENDLAFNYIIYQLSFAMRTEKQIRDKFKKKDKYSQESIEFAIDKAKRLGMIDDDYFCRLYIDECIANKKGINKIKSKLYEKGISKEIYEPIIEEIVNGNSEENIMLNNAIDKCTIRNRTISEPDIYKRKTKLLRYLSGQGFDYNTAKEAVEKVIENIEE